MALEKVTLYGVPIVIDRKVSYGRIDPAAARELFIRHALVEGDWQTSHRFFAENRRLLAEAAELEHRARRRGLVIGEDELFAFYDARIPADVVSAQHFDTWWKRARRSDPDLLTFTAGDLLTDDAAQVAADSYPDSWTSQSPGLSALPLSYAFEPGSDTDGVTVDIPLSQAQPGQPGRVLLAGARAAGRAGHRDDPVAAQVAAPRAGARAGRGPRGRRRASGSRPVICATRSRASCARCAA